MKCVNKGLILEPDGHRTVIFELHQHVRAKLPGLGGHAQPVHSERLVNRIIFPDGLREGFSMEFFCSKPICHVGYTREKYTKKRPTAKR